MLLHFENKTKEYFHIMCRFQGVLVKVFSKAQINPKKTTQGLGLKEG